MVVMALADGVGSKPCDYLASATAVKSFLFHFADNQFQTDIKKRMQMAGDYANQQVVLAPKKCAGMLTTFVAVVWQPQSNTLYYTSAGEFPYLPAT